MNRKQKAKKRMKATRHKDRCKWLKGGIPRKYKKLKGLFVSRGIRISRKKLHEISTRTMNAYLEKAKHINDADYNVNCIDI